jgi:hypothetical protein
MYLRASGLGTVHMSYVETRLLNDVYLCHVGRAQNRMKWLGMMWAMNLGARIWRLSREWNNCFLKCNDVVRGIDACQIYKMQHWDVFVNTDNEMYLIVIALGCYRQGHGCLVIAFILTKILNSWILADFQVCHAANLVASSFGRASFDYLRIRLIKCRRSQLLLNQIVT